MKTKKQKITSWVVKVECTVIKELVCEGCSEEQARNDPFHYSIEERELETPDWDVKSTEPNV